MSDEWCFPPLPSQHYQASSQMSKVNLMLIIQGSLMPDTGWHDRTIRGLFGGRLMCSRSIVIIILNNVPRLTNFRKRNSWVSVNDARMTRIGTEARALFHGPQWLVCVSVVWSTGAGDVFIWGMVGSYSGPDRMQSPAARAPGHCSWSDYCKSTAR